MLAKILNSLLWIPDRSNIIPSTVLKNAEDHIIKHNAFGKNRELCNCLIFFHELNYKSHKLYDLIFLKLNTNNKLYSVMDIETILYCLSNSDSEYKEQLLSTIQTYLIENNETITKSFSGKNYEKIFMGITKNFNLKDSTEDTAMPISQELLMVLLQSLHKNLSLYSHHFTPTNIGAITAYIHPLTKSSGRFDTIKQDLYQEVFRNLVDIEKNLQMKNLVFTLKSLKEVVDTLIKYFERLQEEPFIRKSFMQWYFGQMSVTVDFYLSKKFRYDRWS